MVYEQRRTGFVDSTRGKAVHNGRDAEDRPRVTTYDEQLVRKLIEKITVYDDQLVFLFKSGIQIEING